MEVMPKAKQTKPHSKGAAPKKVAVKTVATKVAEPAPEPVAPAAPRRRYWMVLAVGLPIVLVLAVVLLAGFMVLYAGKVYPGVSVDGAYLGGLSRAKATETLRSATTAYASQAIPISYGSNITISLGVAQIGTTYNIDRSIAQAYGHGRGGNWADDLRQVLRALVDRPTKLSDLTYSDAQLTPYLDQVDSAVTTPVANASLQFSGSSVAVVPSQPGRRLDTGQLVRLIQQRLAAT